MVLAQEEIKPDLASLVEDIAREECKELYVKRLKGLEEEGGKFHIEQCLSLQQWDQGPRPSIPLRAPQSKTLASLPSVDRKQIADELQ